MLLVLLRLYRAGDHIAEHRQEKKTLKQASADRHSTFLGQVLVPVEEAAGRGLGAAVPLCPTEEVPQGHVAVAPCKDAGLPPAQLQLAHDSHHPGAIRRRKLAALLQDPRQLLGWQLLEVQLQKAVAEGSGEHLKEDSVTHLSTRRPGSGTNLASSIAPRRVLCGKEHEVWMRPYRLLRFGHEEFPVVVQDLG